MSIQFVLTIALALFASWGLLAPFFEIKGEQKNTSTDELCERREVIFNQLEDLDNDYRSGKIPEDDYHTLRADLVDLAARILKEIDGELHESSPK